MGAGRVAKEGYEREDSSLRERPDFRTPNHRHDNVLTGLATCGVYVGGLMVETTGGKKGKGQRYYA